MMLKTFIPREALAYTASVFRCLGRRSWVKWNEHGKYFEHLAELKVSPMNSMIGGGVKHLPLTNYHNSK